jgi:hypothetical protein
MEPSRYPVALWVALRLCAPRSRRWRRGGMRLRGAQFRRLLTSLLLGLDCETVRSRIMMVNGMSDLLPDEVEKYEC